MVMGNAVVKDNACVKGKSIIAQNAIISGNAGCNDAQLWGKAKISDNAIVVYSRVHDNASVSKHAQVFNCVNLYDNATITDQAIVSNGVVIAENATVFGKANISSASIHNSSQVSGIVHKSLIFGKSIIKGKVQNCRLKNRIVEQNESLENQYD